MIWSKRDYLVEVYSSALYEIAEEQDCVEGVLSDARGIADMFNSSTEIGDLLFGSHVGISKQRDILDLMKEKMGFSDAIFNIAQVMIKKRRFFLFPDVLGALNSIYSKKKCDACVDVISTQKMSDEQISYMKNLLKDFFSGDIVINNTVNDDIMKGYVVKHGYKVMDLSLAGRLKAVKSSIDSALDEYSLRLS